MSLRRYKKAVKELNNIDRIASEAAEVAAMTNKHELTDNEVSFLTDHALDCCRSARKLYVRAKKILHTLRPNGKKQAMAFSLKQNSM